MTVKFEKLPRVFIKKLRKNFEFGEKTVRIYLMLITFTCIQKVSSIFLQSISSPIKATALALIRDAISFVPLTICLPISMGIEGVLYAAPIADCISIVFTVILLSLEFKKINLKEKLLENQTTISE